MSLTCAGPGALRGECCGAGQRWSGCLSAPTERCVRTAAGSGDLWRSWFPRLDGGTTRPAASAPSPAEGAPCFNPPLTTPPLISLTSTTKAEPALEPVWNQYCLSLNYSQNVNKDWLKEQGSSSKLTDKCFLFTCANKTTTRRKGRTKEAHREERR